MGFRQEIGEGGGKGKDEGDSFSGIMAGYGRM